MNTVAEALAQDFGAVDTLVNGAGGVLDGFAGLADTGPEFYERVMSIGVRGAHLVARSLLPHLRPASSTIRGHRSIIERERGD